MKSISKIVLILLCAWVLLMMFGCTKNTTPTNVVADSAKQSVAAIVAAKPECKDVGEVCNSQIDSITATCNLELDDLNKDIIKWKWSFWSLLMVIGVYIIKRILK